MSRANICRASHLHVFASATMVAQEQKLTFEKLLAYQEMKSK